MSSYIIDSRGKCPHCLLPSRFERTAFYQHSPIYGPMYVEREQEPVDGSGLVIFNAVACAACGGVIVTLLPLDERRNPIGQPKIVFPFNASRPIPSIVREQSPHIANDYEEAASVLELSPKASAALSRRCLQAILNEKGGANQKNLAKQIEAVLPNLPSYIAGDVDAIRNVGNFAAHPQKEQATGQIMDVEVGEAEWNLDVLDSLFDFYYVQPELAKEKRAKLNERLQSAGKPPMKGESTNN